MYILHWVDLPFKCEWYINWTVNIHKTWYISFICACVVSPNAIYLHGYTLESNKQSELCHFSSQWFACGSISHRHCRCHCPHHRQYWKNHHIWCRTVIMNRSSVLSKIMIWFSVAICSHGTLTECPEESEEFSIQTPCYGTFCRPCTICRRRQIVPTLAAHFVAPMHNLTPGDKMCCSGTYGFGATKCAV